ncbi:desiccation protectant protein Lea14 homolog isoform X1 [Malus sylvestris]|uniref:desiccation protectant protein Lea14 homolog isoform X1 n=1 Tax=Malus sylvestris TaxID=3752 RepID=UPI0021AC3AA0|nr:desiccation protectant protein Lea14 homolog isoform X1 [Malus sylvestris]
MQRSASSVSSTKQRSASFVSSTTQRSASSVSSTRQRSASFVSSTMQRSASSVSSTMQRSASSVSSTMQRSASSVSSWYLKVSRLAGSAKNYVASKAQGYVEWRLAEMKKRSALIVGLQFGNQSLDSTELVFEISIFNPFEFYLPVSQASFKFKSAGSEVLTGTLKESASLKPGEESIMFVLVKVPLRVFINLAKDISGDADINYEIDLSIKIKLPIIGNVVSLPIPCECQQGELKLSHLFSKLLDQINRQQLVP